MCFDSHLIRHVGVPLDAADIILDLIVYCTSSKSVVNISTRYQSGTFEDVRKVSVDWQQLGIVLDMSSMLMNMQLAKVSTELLLLVKTNIGKVLSTKDDNSALGYQKREFILLLGIERAELETMDLSAHSWGDLLERRAWGIQEGSFRRIGTEAWVGMLELFQGWLQAWFEMWEIVGIFVLSYVNIDMLE